MCCSISRFRPAELNRPSRHSSGVSVAVLTYLSAFEEEENPAMLVDRALLNNER